VSPGAAAGVRLKLEWRRPEESSWRRSSTAIARQNGSYEFRMRQGQGIRFYRVVWEGVCESNKAIVRAD
jgi:hypothetical protein